MSDKRKIIIINKNFQLRFLLYINALLFVTFITFPIIFIYYMKKLALEGLIPFEHFDKIFYFVIILFVAIQLLAHLLISIFLIFYSHRIAGPLIKIKNTLNGVLKGQDIKEIKFRKNDYFAEFTGPINQFINILTEQNELVKLTEKEINLLKKSYKNDMPIENLSLILERLAKIKIIKE